MIDESNPALPGQRIPSRSVRLSVSLPVHYPPLRSALPAPSGSQAQNPFHFGARPMLRSALRVLQATRQIWREPLA